MCFTACGSALFDHFFEGGLSPIERQNALLSFWSSLAFLAGVGACAWLLNGHRHLKWCSSFVPVACLQWVWLIHFDAAFKQEVEAKQLARRAAELAAEARKARVEWQSGLGRQSKRLTQESRAASLPFSLQESLLGEQRGRPHAGLLASDDD